MSTPGGYRTPSNPAPVSGPGALSRRTDGGQPQRSLPDAKYGENRDYVAQQAGAPLAKAEAPSGAPMASPATGTAGQTEALAAPVDVTPLTAPSARPGEPVTAGSPLGAGPGPVPTSLNAEPGSLSAALAPYLAADDTGVLAALIWNLSERGL